MIQADKNLLWWQEGIIYQIYPRSFQDSDGDGIGDIQGVISRLNYLEWLGVKGIWLSPIYPSPNADFGYDVTDHKAIDKTFGTLEDFDQLVSELHKRDMKLIMDLMPNHTSIEHPWFKASSSSVDDPKHKWYMWKEASEDGSEPNNWLSAFNGPMWEWNDTVKKYYCHSFKLEQPDLDWRNPEVHEATLDIMRFWFDRGVDGFRIDMLHHLVKDELYRDNPPNPEYNSAMGTYNAHIPVFSSDQPYLHTVIAMFRKVADEYKDRVLIGECYVPMHKLIMYYGPNNDGVHLPFNFLLIGNDWNPVKLAGSIARYDRMLPDFAWPTYVMGNHDQPRIAGRVGVEQTRTAAVLLLTLRGTPFMNCGDEIGVKGVPIPVNEMLDPQGIELPHLNLGRDPMRTPMIWCGEENAGFTKGKPWLRIDKCFTTHNVEVQMRDKNSLLSFYKRVMDFRKNEKAITHGHYYHVYADSQILAYIRKTESSDAYLIILNLSHRPCYFRPENKSYSGTVVISSDLEFEGLKIRTPLEMGGDEAFIVKLDQQ